MLSFFIKIDSSFDVGEHTVTGPAGYAYVDAPSAAEAYRQAEGLLAPGQTVAGITYLGQVN